MIHLYPKNMRYPAIEKIAKNSRSEPDPKFSSLTKIGQTAKKRGYYTKKEFLAICRWKSPRRSTLCSLNPESDVKKLTAIIFSSKDDHLRIKELTKLSGVAVPTASALLAVSFPELFGVIDIRAWQVLYSKGAVSKNRRGINLSAKNWLEYLEILRKVAFRIGTSPRLVEISLYLQHKSEQPGTLYLSGKKKCLKSKFCSGLNAVFKSSLDHSKNLENNLSEAHI